MEGPGWWRVDARLGLADRCQPRAQGHFIVWEGAPGARMPWKGHHRHVFLFRNHLVVCKPRRDSRTDTFSYVFRNMMKVCRVPAEPGWAGRQSHYPGLGDHGLVCVPAVSLCPPPTAEQHRPERPGGGRRPGL